ncbi:hypothetical protein OSG44_004995 [Enterobacter mori]|nr:hypothetical protein [Enterobacter mori]
MKNKYRIVADRYAGYEAQVKYWWFPLMWFQIGFCNTSSTVERAKTIIWRHKNKEYYRE